MTKIQQMLDAGIPVIIIQSDETKGSYAFTEMTDEQQSLLDKILTGTMGQPEPATIDERLRAAELIIAMLAEV